MKKIVLGLLIVSVCAAGFARGAKHKKKTSVVSIGNIESVSLRHTACYGRCRVFTISLDKNGSATYEATLFNKDTGVFTKNIGAKATTMINRFSTYRIDTCKNSYTSRMTDIPGYVFTIKYKDSTKKINVSSAGPMVLNNLKVMMDSIVGAKVDNTWRKVASVK